MGFLVFLILVVILLGLASAARKNLTAETPTVVAASVGPRERHRISGLRNPRTGQPLDLSAADGNAEKLRAAGLPDIRDLSGLASFLGLDLRQTAGLLNSSSKIRGELSNYREWTVPKRGSNGRRWLCAPLPRLKAAQRRVLHEILEKVPAHPAAHGFIAGRGIATNAGQHVGTRVVVRVDLRDFFGQLTYPRVMGVFRALGYSRQGARLLALLCTHQPETGIHRRRYAVQGAPTSPAISNLACRRLDARMAGLALRFEAVYTRYGDDLTFSGDDALAHGMKRFLPRVRKILGREGWTANRRKLRVQRAGNQQKVTGLVVNQRVNLERVYLDRLKAILTNAARAGSLESQNRLKTENFTAMIRGHVAHARHYSPRRGERLAALLASIPGEGPAG